MACAKSASSAFEPSVAYRAEEALDALAHLEGRLLRLAFAGARHEAGGARHEAGGAFSRSAGLRHDEAHRRHCAYEHVALACAGARAKPTAGRSGSRSASS